MRRVHPRTADRRDAGRVRQHRQHLRQPRALLCRYATDGAVIFIGSGKISYGKLSQALEHGALTLQIHGDFDDALRRVQQVSRQLGIYLVNSVNPFRLEGQKTIMYRVLEALQWEVPDWVVVPGGNLGNVSAFAKAFGELLELGLIPRVPRLAVINATGADTFYQLHEKHGLRWNGGAFDRSKIDSYYAALDANHRKADTLASAIEINRPVNLPKALRALDRCKVWCGRSRCGDSGREGEDRRGRPRMRTGQRRERRRAAAIDNRRRD